MYIYIYICMLVDNSITPDLTINTRSWHLEHIRGHVDLDVFFSMEIVEVSGGREHVGTRKKDPCSLFPKYSPYTHICSRYMMVQI